jgi:2'-5' RNA ligase
MEVRCFIAVGLPDGLRGEIDRQTGRLRKLDADVRWVPLENLHLTLKFLGNTPEKVIPEIEIRLQEVVGSVRGFEISFSGVGVFPSPRRPRVVWIGISEGAEAMRVLQGAVEEAVSELGFEPEKRGFSPHLTLGRLRSQRGSGAVLKELDALKGADFGTMAVRGVSLLKSELSPSGAKYTALYEAVFGG